MTTSQTWYRFTDRKVGLPYDEDYKLRIVLERFWVAKETRCGVWLTSIRPAPNGWIPDWAHKRFVNLNGRRHWAWPSIADAWISYGARKECQVGYLEAQLERARRGLNESRIDFSEVVKAHGIHIEEWDQP